MTFWDFCSPIYDFVQKQNKNYKKWINEVINEIDNNAEILEIAGGTGSISIKASQKVKSVICTDISNNMLKIAKRKAKNIGNISFEVCDIYNTKYKDNSFDITIASQVLHLLDNPGKAVEELLRITKNKLILPLCLTKNVKGFEKFKINLWKTLGFKPKYEFDEQGYIKFIEELNLKIIKSKVIKGEMPMMIVVCKK
jgi:Methylase involved in ubiquinone/menaquinone biosynthesis